MHKIIRSFIFSGAIAVSAATVFAQHVMDKDTAAKLVAAKEPIVKTTDDKELKLVMTQEIATLAFTAGDLTKAAFYANDLLIQAESMKENWDYGNAVHAANLVLGRVALASGNVDDAKTYLLAAGRTPGSPQLDSFGPDMLFAQELLAKGEKNAVIQYLDMCSKFWKMGDDDLAKWKTEIETDKMPNFGPNTRYFF